MRVKPPVTHTFVLDEPASARASLALPGRRRRTACPTSLPLCANSPSASETNGGHEAKPEIQGMTRRLIFSSWVAAPSLIDSLLTATRLSDKCIRVPEGSTTRSKLVPRSGAVCNTASSVRRT